MKEAEIDTIESLDGRRQRSARSRAAIIEASFELMQEGVLAPTAQQIAERAGVGIRSFFRHFEDMESLASASDEHIRSTYEALWAGGDRSGGLDERIQRAVERHSDAYEQVAHLILSTRSPLPWMQNRRWRLDYPLFLQSMQCSQSARIRVVSCLQ